MVIIKTEMNPIGKVYFTDDIKNVIEGMKTAWDESNNDIPWWKVWKKINFVPVINYLISCLDDLINLVADMAIPGTDKKATVLAAIESIYDHVIANRLPMWLKPFAGMIKDMIINKVVAVAIDWIAEKYSNGGWIPKVEVIKKYV